MDSKYTVMFTGELCSGFNFDEVLKNFISLTKMEAEKAKKFLSSTKPVLIKKDVDRDTAEKYQSGFTKAGLKVELVGPDSQPKEAPAIKPAEKVFNETSAEAKAQAIAINQAAAIQSPVAPSSVQDVENPYAAPKADLKVEKKDTPGDWLEYPQKVPGSNGWHWVKDAAAIFFAAPWKWLGITLVAMLITIPMNFIPFVGGLVNTFLGLLLAGGMLMGAHELAEGGELTFGHLFKGFKHNRNQLLMIGVIYLAFFILLGIIGFLLIGGSLGIFSGMAGGNPGATPMPANLGMFWFFMLAVVLVSFPFMMAYWFTTPLVALSGKKAFASYKLSFKACAKNWLAFLVYGLVFGVIGVFFTIGFSITGSLFSIFLGGENSMLLAFIPIIIMGVVVFPLIIIGGLSVYTSFRDIFYREA